MSQAPHPVLRDRIAVVTGASRGIGYAAALACAQAGAHVIAVDRTVGGLEELDDEIRADGGAATLVPIDLRDFDAIDRLGGTIFERWKRLDVLIGAAGILGNLSPLGHVEPDDWDAVMAVNVTANWRLIRSLDPLLRQSAAGRATFLSSGAAYNARPFWGPYAVSKAALVALVRCYAAETKNTAIRANLVDPGIMATAMRAKAMPGEDPTTLPEPKQLAPHLVALSAPEFERTGEIFEFGTNRFLTPELISKDA
jgi:NAD(P)-dependent dehydrogenase (short-subunit alcohol dehydrogenase family)